MAHGKCKTNVALQGKIVTFVTLMAFINPVTSEMTHVGFTIPDSRQTCRSVTHHAAGQQLYSVPSAGYSV
jgi:hypothetical protein